MHDNLILSGIPEAMQDNPEEAVKKCMHSALKLPMTTVNTITFNHMQRTRRSDDKWPRPIVAKFYKQYNYKYKEFLKRKARELWRTHFGLNDQFPKEIQERWKKMYPNNETTTM